MIATGRAASWADEPAQPVETRADLIGLTHGRTLTPSAVVASTDRGPVLCLFPGARLLFGPSVPLIFTNPYRYSQYPYRSFSLSRTAIRNIRTAVNVALSVPLFELSVPLVWLVEAPADLTGVNARPHPPRSASAARWHVARDTVPDEKPCGVGETLLAGIPRCCVGLPGWTCSQSLGARVLPTAAK
jgi:hypothetical protein